MPALIACHPVSLGSHQTPASFDRLAELGLTHWEWPVADSRFLEPFDGIPLLHEASTEQEIAAALRWFQERGHEVVSADITGLAPENDAEFARILARVEVALALGVKRIVGSAGQAEDQETWNSLCERLARIGDRCRTANAVFCLQNEPGICQDHHLMWETIRRIDHPSVRINFDTGNILSNNTHIHGEVALAKICHLVKHVHLQDSNGEYGRRYSPALGCGGGVDFARVLQLLKVSGFHGPYSLTIRGIEGEPPQPLDVCLRRLADSLKQLRNVGFFDS